jgi:hypothetical protein
MTSPASDFTEHRNIDVTLVHALKGYKEVSKVLKD